MKMTEDRILIGNRLIAEFMGYVYFEPDVLIDNSDCGGIYDPTDIYSKVPIEVNDYPEDKQKYFKDLPNPDFGKENPEHWASNIEKISCGSLNREYYIEELNYDWSWNELMPVVEKINKTFFDYYGTGTKLRFTFCLNDDFAQILSNNKEAVFYNRVQDGEELISAIYKTVVEFIKFYNEKK